MIPFLNHYKTILKKPFVHAGFKKYASNTGWLFAEQILRILSGILVGIWVARYLGAELFGIYSYAVSFVALFGALVTLGLQAVVVKELINKPEEQERIMGTAFYMQVAGALMVTLLIALILPFTSNDSTTNFYILIIAGGLIFQSFQVIDYYFQSKVLSKYVSICRLFQLGASTILKVWFVLTQADLVYFIVIIVIDNASLAIALLYAYWRQRKIAFFTAFDTRTFRHLLTESWPLIISGLVIMVYMKIDQVMLKEMMDAKSVGVYSAAVKLSEAWYFVPMIVSQSVFPAILNARKLSETLYRLRLQRLLNLMMFCSLGIALVFTFASHYIVDFLYGPDFKEAAAVLSIQIWAGIAVSSGVVSSSWFVTEGLQKYSMYRTAAGALTNVVLNLLLIPKFGIIGCAIATLASQMIASILLNAFHRETRQIFLLQLKAIVSLGLYGNQLKQQQDDRCNQQKSAVGVL